jgi:3-oxoacyl-[acyl-carrier protein] reductase
MRLAGRVVLVTGGGHGIGRAYCMRVAREGADVVVADIDGDAATRVADDINSEQGSSEGGRALAQTCDVTSLASMEDVVAAADDRFGGIDGLVNNAGMLTIRPISRVGFESIDEAEWDQVIDTNLKGTWLTCRAAAPSMRRRGGGSIVNIGSGTFFLGSATRAHYVASKGAVMGLSRVLSRELAPDGIRVNVLVPGSTLSEDDPTEAQIAFRQLAVANRSIKRIQMPEDLVGAAVFFLSDDSAFITGQTLVIEGGNILH